MYHREVTSVYGHKPYPRHCHPGRFHGNADGELQQLQRVLKYSATADPAG
jgi:hypothetical protein